jgi:hypothetical protein
MVGWCLICWFYCTALLGADNDLGGILAAHFVGSGVVFVLIAVSSLLFSGTESEGDDAPGAPSPSTRFVFEYSLAVGLAMAVGLALGDAWLTTDPTLILNATLMIIFPSLAHTWTLAVDRFIGAVLGIVLGFSLGFLIQHPWLEPAIWMVFSFFILSMMNVNSGAVTFFFLALFAAGWGTQGYEVGNAIANERIFAEFVGVGIAIIAVAARNRFGRASG